MVLHKMTHNASKRPLAQNARETEDPTQEHLIKIPFSEFKQLHAASFMYTLKHWIVCLVDV